VDTGLRTLEEPRDEPAVRRARNFRRVGLGLVALAVLAGLAGLLGIRTATTSDSGGVHTNSNIHNKAAYNMLTAKDGNGARVFTPTEAAVLYYLCLSRLSSMATFTDVLHDLTAVVSIYYAGDPAKKADRVNHVTAAYKAVGIQ